MGLSENRLPATTDSLLYHQFPILLPGLKASIFRHTHKKPLWCSYDLPLISTPYPAMLILNTRKPWVSTGYFSRHFFGTIFSVCLFDQGVGLYHPIPIYRCMIFPYYTGDPIGLIFFRGVGISPTLASIVNHRIQRSIVELLANHLGGHFTSSHF